MPPLAIPGDGDISPFPRRWRPRERFFSEWRGIRETGSTPDVQGRGVMANPRGKPAPGDPRWSPMGDLHRLAVR
jgi:hypothetical protein